MKAFLKDMKYLTGYSVPLLAFISIRYPENFAFLTLLYTFGILPLTEHFLPASQGNFKEEQEVQMNKKRRFDWILWLSVPAQWGVLIYYLYLISTNDYSILQITGMTIAVGICSGVIGINVAHELGHRSNTFEKFLSQCLLLSTLYMHFFVEHNRGHHRYVATPKDPATARLGENVYAFILRSIVGGYRSAWKIQRKLLEKSAVGFWTLHNTMLLYLLLQLTLIAAIVWVFGWMAMFLFLATAAIGITLLEVINYVEHYGLLRKEISSGVYEKVQPHHSWNSDHTLGRVILFELTRHADHHYKASRKYQTLRHFDDSPQLPSGYPAMMLLSIIPPIWFQVMNPRVNALKASSNTA